MASTVLGRHKSVMFFATELVPFQELRKTLKNWSQKFEMEDAMRKMTASKELIEKRQMLMHNFNIMRAKKEKTYLATKDLRLRLRGGKLCMLKQVLSVFL